MVIHNMLNIIKFIFTLLMLIVSITIIVAVWIDHNLTLGVQIGVTCMMGIVILGIFYLYYRVSSRFLNKK